MRLSSAATAAARRKLGASKVRRRHMPSREGGDEGCCACGASTHHMLAAREPAVDTAPVRSLRSVEDEPFAQRARDEMSTRTGADLRHRIARVRAHGVVCDPQLLCDLGAGASKGDHANDLPLAPGELF